MPVGTISNELKETISTLAVMRSCATDPGHVILLTGELINWIVAGLTAKYGYELTDLDELTFELINQNNEESYIQKWEYAIDQYNAHRSFWGTALKICRQVAEGMLQIAVEEDLLDYSLVAQTFTQQMQQQMESVKQQEETSSSNTAGKQQEPVRRRGYQVSNGDDR